MRSGRWALAAALLGVALASPAKTLGETTGAAAAAADKLFDTAVKHMKASNFEAACPLLDESIRLDPRDGTLFTLANCRDLEGKITTALGHYRKYLGAYDKMKGMTRFKHRKRADIARKRVKEIAPIVPSVKFAWTGDIPPGTKFLLDGVETTIQIDTALQLDPGEHHIDVEREGAPTESHTVTLESGKPTVDVDLTPKPFEPPKSDKPPPVVEPPPVQKDSTPRNWRRIGGFVSLGVGGAALAVGGIFGGLALAKKGTVDSECTPSGEMFDCTPSGRAAVDDIVTYGTPSTIGFVAGGVLAAAGVVLVLTAPKAKAKVQTGFELKVDAAPGAGFVKLEGVF